jgi:2-polyprenyl-6-methoxyphenol hydroxylase-like FAD-dependent oxidoreductase
MSSSGRDDPVANPDYDVIIVGGRPAGASLAARLGKRGVRVLIVDRATFPSHPGVPSSPAIHAGTMALLDELGIEQATYDDVHARMRALLIDIAGVFTAKFPVPKLANGRDYVMGIDRAKFDAALWDHLDRFPSVEKRSGFNVTNLAWQGKRVVGIIGATKGETPREITARCIIGADGRYSLIARKAGSEIVEDASTYTSTVYFANWKGVKPLHPDYQVGYVHATARGLDALFFAMPNGEWCINTHARSDRVRIDGNPERYYMDTLRSLPRVWKYLEKAERTSNLMGIKQIGNGYRRPSGPGWVLVGDAVHYKDPADGQGIYDALISAKLLDGALDQWLSEKASWESAMDSYRRELWNETHAMFIVTTTRIKRELYSEPPMPIVRTLMRWMMTDPQYAETFIRVQGRDRPPESLLSNKLAASAVARSIWREITSR